MRRMTVMLLSVVVAAGIWGARVAFQTTPLNPQDAEIQPAFDVYGRLVRSVEGQLVNESGDAYTAVSLFAEVYDANDTVIGEGFGTLVNACGAGLLDFTLQPGAARPFLVPLEMFEEGEIARINVTAEGTPTTPGTETPPPELAEGVRQVSNAEVASIEWIDESHLRYGIGCWRDLFFERDWRELNIPTLGEQAVEHPKAELITDALRLQLGLVEDLYFNHSMLNYAPDTRRMLYQTEVNALITAEPDGSFKRVLLENLSTRTLQSITWLDNGTFLAAYYGAVGDPVAYFTATVEGRMLSEPPETNPLSIITPGATPDGEWIVFAAEIDGITGYYWKRAAFAGASLLFQMDPPGNNWPGPVVDDAGEDGRFIYAAAPVNGEARLLCYNLGDAELHDLTPLPLQLGTDERAVWSLSPEANTIALAADGINGGLWLIDLNTVGDCA